MSKDLEINTLMHLISLTLESNCKEKGSLFENYILYSLTSYIRIYGYRCKLAKYDHNNWRYGTLLWLFNVNFWLFISCLKLFGSIWPFVTLCGLLWSSEPLCGISWAFAALCGFCGFLWLFVALCDHLWPFLASCGSLWLVVAFFLLFFALFGPLWPFFGTLFPFTIYFDSLWLFGSTYKALAWVLLGLNTLFF